jgi:ElaB/YqjD/DUF883 family membrane-anchored ribosome-binding protein
VGASSDNPEIVIRATNVTQQAFDQVKDTLKTLGDHFTSVFHEIGMGAGDSKAHMLSLSDVVKDVGSKFGVSTDLITEFLGPLGEIGVVGGAVALGIAAVGEEVIKLAHESADTGDHINDMALKMGTTATRASQLSFAITVAGGDADRLANSVFMMSKRLEDSGPAGDKARHAVANLGIDVKAFLALDTDQQILAISDAFRETAPNANTVSDIFGRQGREILPQLMKPLSELVEKSAELGQVWGEDEVKGAVAAAMESRKLHAEWEKLWTDLGTFFIPALELTDWTLGKVVEGFRHLGKAISDDPDLIILREGWHKLNGELIDTPKVTGDAKHGVDALLQSVKDNLNTAPSMADAFLNEKIAAKELDDSIKELAATRKKAAKEAEEIAKGQVELDAESVRVHAGILLELGGHKFGNGMATYPDPFGTQKGRVYPNFGNRFIDHNLGFGPANITYAAQQDMDATKGGFLDRLGLSGDVLNSTILRTFEGGGDVGKSVGGLLAGSVTKSLVDEGVTNALKGALGKTLGGALGSVLPGVGTILGGLGGQLLGNLFTGTEESRLVNKPREQFIEAAGGLDVLNPAIQRATGSLKLMQDLFGAKTEKYYKVAVDAITTAISGFDKKLQAAAQSEELVAAKLSHIREITPDLQTALEKAFNAKTPDEYSAALTGINGIVDGQLSKQQELNATLQEFGIEWTKTGTQAKEAHLADLTDELSHKFDVLSGAGVSVNDIMDGMKPRMTSFIVEARKAGVEVPDTFKKIIQDAIDAGDLFDENGNKITDMSQTGVTFGQTMAEVSKTLSDDMKRLADVIQNLGGVIQGVGHTADVAFRDRQFHVQGVYDAPADLPNVDFTDVPGAADGVFATQPTLRMFGEGGEPELGGPVDFMSKALAGAIAQAGGGSMGGGDIYIAVDAGSGEARQLSQVDFQQIERGIQTGLIKIPQRMIGARAR